MKLKEFLDTQPEKRILYVGAKSAFLLGGTKKQIMKAIPAMDEKIAKRERVKREDLKAKYRNAQKDLGNEHDKTKRLYQRLIDMADPLPLLEREILDTFERTTEDALNIIIVGDEVGNVWSIHEKDAFEVNYNIDVLVGAILKDVITDYKYTFRAELMELREILIRLDKYRKESERFEKYLQSNDVKVFTTVDPEYLISKTRKIVAEMLADGARKKRREAENAKNKNS